ncbi:hypothetical protein ACJ73_02467 [Blastomyces percursus]|uniref:Uncharacterized protein n=1 Tax=Blastomyces percursus TaxID=1658174 RepID=A0A1J9RES4_9EURO|nr:hypothetical protein ACJ73_02467 [Blastomyces percursus]
MPPDGACLRPSTQNLKKRPSQADIGNGQPEGHSEKKRKDDNQPLEVDSQCYTDDEVLWDEVVKSRQEEENKARQEGRRIRRSPVKCCYCDYIDAPDLGEKCSSCRRKVCEICFHFQEAPSPSKEESKEETILAPEPDEHQDELWENVREFLRRCKGGTTTPNRENN